MRMESDKSLLLFVSNKPKELLNVDLKSENDLNGYPSSNDADSVTMAILALRWSDLCLSTFCQQHVNIEVDRHIRCSSLIR